MTIFFFFLGYIGMYFVVRNSRLNGPYIRIQTNIENFAFPFSRVGYARVPCLLTSIGLEIGFVITILCFCMQVENSEIKLISSLMFMIACFGGTGIGAFYEIYQDNCNNLLKAFAYSIALACTIVSIIVIAFLIRYLMC